MEPIQLQLDALKMLQQWSMWIITLSSTFIGFIGFAFKNILTDTEKKSAKLCVSFLLATVVLAVFLVSAIPAVIQKLPVVVENPFFLGVNPRGVYSALYLDFIPLWVLISGQRITFLIGLFFGTRLVWLKYGKNEN